MIIPRDNIKKYLIDTNLVETQENVNENNNINEKRRSRRKH